MDDDVGEVCREEGVDATPTSGQVDGRVKDGSAYGAGKNSSLIIEVIKNMLVELFSIGYAKLF